jgi:putative ABC transport system permease protein
MLTRLLAFFRGMSRRRQIEAELDEEIRDHLERQITANVARGLSTAEARRAALRDLGGITQTIEAVREVRATSLETLWRDVRFALRALRRSPRFTATALILLMVGIGTATAIFSVAQAVLVRPLPYPDPNRLVYLVEKDGLGIVWPNFEDWRQRARSFDGLAAWLADAVIVTSETVPRRLQSCSVTANFFTVLGVQAIRGRLFDEADARPDAPRSVVISHALWQRDFGSDRAALGRTLVFNRNPFTVIGVLPPGFHFMAPADVYVLLEPQIAADYRGMQSRNTRTSLYAVGRLKPDVTLTAVRAEMQTITEGLTLEHPGMKGHDAQVLGLADRIVQDIAPTLTVVAGAVTLLLLIACVNLASLLLNRNASRAHEFGVRAALGGTQWSLVRQLLIEHGLLVATGGIAGALVGALLLQGLLAVAPRDMPRFNEISLDLTLLAWTTAVCCLCAFGVGLVPAVGAFRVRGQQLLVREGRVPRSTTPVRRALVMAEITVATVLLSGSALMVHTMLRLTRVDPGFDPNNLQSIMFSLQGPTWPDARKQVFYDEAVDRLRAVPGVENAAITYSLPFLGSNWWTMFMTEGTTNAYWQSVGEFPNAGIVPVTAGYFEGLRIPLLKGRYFNRSDTPDSQPVAIVNSGVVRKFFLNQDPIGKRIQLGVPESYGPWRTIVGIVGEIRQEGIDRNMPSQVFLPIVQQPRTTAFAVVRMRGAVPPASLEAALHELDRTIPVFNDRTVTQVRHEASSRRRLAMVVLTAFGSVAVLLAAIGLYGVIAQSVASRRREIGIRMALGAAAGRVVRQFLQQGIVAVVFGLTLGIVATLAAAQSLASLVFGVTTTDPATLATVAAVLTMITLLATYLAARAAARVDPVVALRSE